MRAADVDRGAVGDPAAPERLLAWASDRRASGRAKSRSALGTIADVDAKGPAARLLVWPCETIRTAVRLAALAGWARAGTRHPGG